MTSWSPDWDLLQEAIGGEVILADSSSYEVARKPALARYHNSRPQAIVLASSASDVAETIRFGRRFGLRTSPRSGGHCFAGRSSTGDIIIDVASMCSVSFLNDVVTVGAGARLGNIYDALAARGRTIPAGCGPSVGIAGLTLGGGLGTLGRKYGLTCDHLLSARVVLADGRIVDCDEHHDAELFWGLRGAGGGQLGVVTSLVFATKPAPTSTFFHLVWSPLHANAVFDVWQTWAPAAPDELDANLRLTVSGKPDRSPVVHLFGAMLGGKPDTDTLLDEFVSRVGANPETQCRQPMSYREVKRRLSGLGSVDAEQDQQWSMFSKSEFFQQPLPRHAITSVLDAFVKGCGPGQSRELNLTPWGGAYNRVPSHATAFVHRDELFMIEHVVMVDPASPSAELSAARAWLSRSWASVHPWASGRVYPNFPDPELENCAEAYFGSNLERLLWVKQKYDPGNWFSFPQSLGSQLTTATRERPYVDAPGTGLAIGHQIGMGEVR